MTFDFYGNFLVEAQLIRMYILSSGPWDEKTGIFAPLFHQPYQVETESLRNVVRKRDFLKTKPSS